jgi:ribosomal protein L11 methyltransferase
VTRDKYYRLQLKNVFSDQQELIALWCFERGASGVSENLSFTQNPQDYSVRTVANDTATLEAYFMSPLSADDLSQIQANWPNVEVSWHSEEARDWLAEWKKGFVPFALVDDVWVVPHWCQRPKAAREVILMEPGMAFGTGTHETTKLAAQLLAACGSSASRVLDVGTGTGILAILARLLGAQHIEATDIDPDAVRVAKENLALNKITDIKVCDDDLRTLQRPFDVVVANIIDGVLVMLQSDLKRLVAPGGHLILSGIIDERVAIFKEKFEMAGFTIIDHRTLNEWHGFRLQKV